MLLMRIKETLELILAELKELRQDVNNLKNTSQLNSPTPTATEMDLHKFLPDMEDDNDTTYDYNYKEVMDIVSEVRQSTPGTTTITATINYPPTEETDE